MADGDGFGIFQRDYAEDPDERAATIKKLVGPLMDHIGEMVEEKMLNTVEGDTDGLVAWMEDEDNREVVGEVCAMLVKTQGPATLYVVVNVIMNFLIKVFAEDMKQSGSYGDDFWDAIANKEGSQNDTFFNNLQGSGREVEQDTLRDEGDDDDLDSFLRGD